MEETMKLCIFKSNYAKITTVILSVLVVLTVIMGCLNPMTTNASHEKEDGQNEYNFINHISMGYINVVDYLQEDVIYEGWGLRFSGFGPPNPSVSYIEEITFNYNELKIHSVIEDPFGPTDTWTNYVILPDLEFGNTYNIKIKSYFSSVDVDVTIPYPITYINFPEKIDFAHPFNLEWIIDENNFRPIYLSRIMGHDSCSDSTITPNCCEYFFHTILSPMSRNFTLNALELPEDSAFDEIQFRILIYEIIEDKDVSIRVIGLSTYKVAYYNRDGLLLRYYP